MNIVVFTLVISITFQVKETGSLDLWSEVPANSNEVNYTVAMEGQERVLSRRKRFLTFPDGSSLQLVFCCQNSALINIGDIFLFSSTAALAWNLPQDPNFIHMFKHDGAYSMAQRRNDQRHIYYIGSNGKVIAKVPYRRKPIVNPAFAKRSATKPCFGTSINKTEMHVKQAKREYLNLDHMDHSRIIFHRSSRFELFQKLEVLFRALGQRNGRHCIHRQLCQIGSDASHTQGSFLEEIRRAVFTLPKSRTHQDTQNDYDNAHFATEDCIKEFPDCDDMQIVNVA